MQISRLRNIINRHPCPIFHQKSSFISSYRSAAPAETPLERNRKSRPTTISPVFEERMRKYNNVSFIGSVADPVELYDTTTMDHNPGAGAGAGAGAYTKLSIHPSEKSPHKLRIRLNMWGVWGKLSFKYLEPDDIIYVSGRLDSYEKTDENGKLKTYYSVHVNDINFVELRGEAPDFKKREKSDLTGQTQLEKRNSILRLWQVFFVTPNEWWDNRENKKNPREPDFKHKDTKEALWLSSDDPPWLIRQLQLYDSRMAEHGYGSDRYSGLTKFEL